MNKSYEPKSTKSMKAVSASMVLDSCCEPECGMTILVEKEDQEQGRQLRCVPCTMRKKFSSKPPPR